MKLVAAVASHLSTSASVTTTAESARIELESSSPWVVMVVGKVVVVVVGKLVMVGKMGKVGKVGKGMLRLCFLLGSSDHSCNTNAGAMWGTATQLLGRWGCEHISTVSERFAVLSELPCCD